MTVSMICESYFLHDMAVSREDTTVDIIRGQLEVRGWKIDGFVISMYSSS